MAEDEEIDFVQTLKTCKGDGESHVEELIILTLNFIIYAIGFTWLVCRYGQYLKTTRYTLTFFLFAMLANPISFTIKHYGTGYKSDVWQVTDTLDMVIDKLTIIIFYWNLMRMKLVVIYMSPENSTK